MRARSFVVVVAVASAACTLFVDTGDFAHERATASETTDAGVFSSGDDGAAQDVSVAPPNASPCPTGAFFCDDFESGFGKWEEHPDSNGRIALVTTASHSPIHAFEARTVDGTKDFQAELRASLPSDLKSGLLVFRAWIRLEGDYIDETALVKVRGVDTLEDMNLKLLADGRLKIDADVDGEGDELVASEPVTRGQWSCVEWQAELGRPGRSKLLVNGETVIDAVETNVPATGYRVFGFGFPGLVGPNQRVLWDDVVVTTAPVGCR